MKNKTTSLKNKLLLWFLLLTLTPLIGVSLISYFQYSNSLVTKAASELQRSSKLNKAFIENWFDFRLKDINNQSESQLNSQSIEKLSKSYKKNNIDLKSFIKSYQWVMETEQIQASLMTLQRNYDYIYDIFLIDTSADILFTLAKESDLGTNLSTGLFKDTKFAHAVLGSLSSGKTLFSGVERYAPSNDLLSAFFTAPLTNETGDMVGVIAIQIKLDNIFTLLATTSNLESESNINEGQFIHYLVDKNRTLQTPIDQQWQDILHKTVEGPFQKSIHEGFDESNEHITNYVNHENNHIMASLEKVTISNIEWILVTEIPLKSVLKDATWLATTTAILVILFVFIIVIIVMSITKKITTPLVLLTKASIKAASSDENLSIEQTTDDEIGQLTSSFNYMIEKRNTHLLNIKQSSHKLDLILKNTRVGFWDYDINEGMVQCNPRWYEITGYSEDDLSPFTIERYIALIHPEDVNDTKHSLFEHIKNQLHTYDVEFRMQHKNGHWVWLHDSGSVVERTEQNRATRAIGTISDITADKQYKIEQEKSYQSTQVKFSISKVLNQDTSLKVRLDQAIDECFNLSSLNILKQGGVFLLPKGQDALSMCSLRGKFSDEFIKKEQQVKLGCCLCGKSAQSKEIIISDNCFEDHRHDNTFEGMTAHGHYIVPLVHTSGAVKTTVGVLFLYTEVNPKSTESIITLLKEVGSLFTAAIVQEQARNLLEEASNLAEQNNSLKSEFLASMSHEIRTPMNGVLGMLDLLMSSGLNDDQTQKAQLAQSSAESLLVLINDILDFSKIEAGKMELEQYDFNLLTMLGEFAKTIGFNAQEKGLELLLDTSQITKAMVKGDQGRIRQILTNLVGNAIKFTHKGEIIIKASVTATKNNKLQLICSIQDTGIGIPQEKINTLFDSFSQVDASTTRIYGGTGLGLTISKNLCELMGGQVSVSSVIDQGSCFEFVIELQPSSKINSNDISDEIKALNILLVDDNKNTLDVLSTSLTQFGIKVSTANNGKDAISLCKDTLSNPDTTLFDAIFIDSQMPSLNGKDLAISLNDDDTFSNMKKVMMTAISESHDTNYYSNLDVCFNFSKPATYKDLLSALTFITKKESDEKEDGTIDNKETASANESNENDWPKDYRILLVEDNRINQVVAQGVLKRFNLKADVANNGIEALEALKESVESTPFTLILMDCQMPEMDGYQATQEIRKDVAGKQFSSIPILAMTANAMDGDKEQCIEAGMDDYLTKPINPALLEQKLNQWLFTPEETRANLSQKRADEIAVKKGKAKEKEINSNKIAINDITESEPSSTNDNSPTENIAANKPIENDHDNTDNDPLLIWNEEECLQRVSQNTDLLKKLLNVFIEESPQTISKITKTINSIKEINQRNSITKVDIALDDENTKSLCKELLKLAHLMKGLTGNLSAEQFYQFASKLEFNSKNEDIEQIISSNKQLTQAHKNLMIELKSYISQ